MRRFKLLMGIISICFIVIMSCRYYTEYSVDNQYLRFHVVANSDSPEDQALKLDVRDRLLYEFSEKFKDVDCVEEAEEIVMRELHRLEEIANDEIARQGKDYKAKAIIGFFDFPIKSYGNLVLPAGRYHALKIVLGEGAGANWWCVMFPPLCFVDISHGVATDVQEDNAVEEKDAHMEVLQNVERNDVESNKDMLDTDPTYVDDDSLNTRQAFESSHSDDMVQGLEDEEQIIEYRFKSREWFDKSISKMMKLFSFVSDI